MEEVDEKVTVSKQYIINRMKSLEQTPIMQEYIYLQTKLKESEAPIEGSPDEDKKE